MSTIFEESLQKHLEWKGKMVTNLKMPLNTQKELSLAYSPGVAEPCRAISKNKDDVYKYTWKGNTVAVISDGSAVLGLGDIGPEAGLPVMEGKAALFKQFANVDCVPICLDTKDTQEIISICKALAPTFGGFNLEDIAAPRCVEIERALIEELDIPVFHDDQHGTAIVSVAAIHNALKLVNKKKEDVTVVVSGMGAAGSSIVHMLLAYGIKNIYGFNSKGVLLKEDIDSYNFLSKELCQVTNLENKRISLKDAMAEADIFLGVSAAGIISKEMVSSMKEGSIVFAMANPDPEIPYDDAKEAGATIAGTGRSDYPNQVNNVLAFPGLFRGALDVRARKINEEMKMAAAMAIASLVRDDELKVDYVIPSPLDPRVGKVVAEAVAEAARKTGVARI